MATTYDPTTADPGQIEKIPAGDVIIDPNVRTAVRLDKSFISSIRVYGFQQHPVGYRDPDNKIHITVGQRRTSAALEIGWPVIPIVVKPQGDAEHDRAEELRILAQLAENEQRTALTGAELAAGYKQLALLGVSDDQIARKTNAPKQHVQTALAVAGSVVAAAALQSRPITLEQAAYLVEFEDDSSAVESLTETLETRPEQIDHTVARLRSDREVQAAVTALTAQLQADGWEVQYSPRNYSLDVPRGAENIESLWKAGDATRTRISSPEGAAEYSGRLAIVYPTAWRDEKASASYFISGYADQGLETWAHSTGSGKGPLTDEEKAARKQKRTDKADMILATDVRRAWITEFLTSKKLPDMSRWVAHAIFQTEDALGASQREGNARDLAFTLLGLEAPSTKYGYMSREASADFVNSHDGLATKLTAAYAIAVVEDVIGDPKHAWAGIQHPDLAPYLEQLHEWGYALSDVEQRLVDVAVTQRIERAAGLAETQGSGS